MAGCHLSASSRQLSSTPQHCAPHTCAPFCSYEEFTNALISLVHKGLSTQFSNTPGGAEQVGGVATQLRLQALPLVGMGRLVWPVSMVPRCLSELAGLLHCSLPMPTPLPTHTPFTPPTPPPASRWWWCWTAGAAPRWA